jgi:hypothetical protein
LWRLVVFRTVKIDHLLSLIDASSASTSSAGLTNNSEAGAAWVYTRSGRVWTQQGLKLVGTGAVGAAQQGFRPAECGPPDRDTAPITC